MKSLITVMKIVTFGMLATITCCVVYIALWFEQYERMIS